METLIRDCKRKFFESSNQMMNQLNRDLNRSVIIKSVFMHNNICFNYPESTCLALAGFSTLLNCLAISRKTSFFSSGEPDIFTFVVSAEGNSVSDR